jgi:catechol 2,3-dioxygenase-like lactoylglutathione lyase family enzyme
VTRWYSRPLFFVADVEAAVGFYVEKLCFRVDWKFEQDGKVFVAQVARSDCELILSSQWPDKNGKGMVFVSLDLDVLIAARQEFEAKGVKVSDGWWGYKCAIIEDLDGNVLYFPYPNDQPANDQSP